MEITTFVWLQVQTLVRKKLSTIQDSRGLFTRTAHTKTSFAGSPGRSDFVAVPMSTFPPGGEAAKLGDGPTDTTVAVYPTEDEESTKML